MIGAKTTIRGNVVGEEDLLVEGRIEGSVRLTKDLTVGEGAAVLAQVEARAVTVAGQIQGTVVAQTTLVIEAGASVVADLTTPRLHIAEGAHFKGRVSMPFEIEGVEAPKKPAAPDPRAAPPTPRRR